MELTLDMETRSSVKLKECGLYVYAEGDDTDVMCLAVKEDDQPARIYVPKKFRYLGPTDISCAELTILVQNAQRIYAHNASFERILWRDIMATRYKFCNIPFNKWRCTAAKAVICMEGREEAFEFSGALFAEQRRLDEDAIFDVAERYGAAERLRACVSDPDTDARLRDDIGWAIEHEIRGTPLVLVNGRKASPLPPFLYALVLAEGDPDHPAFAALERRQASGG